MSVHLITGGAGFVGVNLAQALLDRGDQVLAVDDLSRGRRELLGILEKRDGFAFAAADCVRSEAIDAAAGTREVDAVWHLAANSDISAGVADPTVDLHRTFMTTFGALAFMRARGVGRLHFASSSAVYGDHGERPVHERTGPLEPISNYGAMKLASEAQIRAAVEAWLPRADVFRFPNVIGTPATHGVIWDFVRKLQASPQVLEVLGDGTQRKAYLHVTDLVAAMLHVAAAPDPGHRVFNIGPTDEGVTVRSIAEAVRDRVQPDARIAFGEGARGWVGDVPRFRYVVDKVLASGWTPRMGSADAVRCAVDEIALQEMGA